MDRIFAICRAMRWGAGIIAMSVGCVDAAIAQEASSAWSLSAEYTADLAGVASGGIERGVRYLDNIDVIAEADLDALIGWHGGKAHAALLNNMGGKPNDLAGSIQGINNIEVSQGRFKLYEAWVEQALAPGWSLRAGLYDVNSEFYQNDAAGLLISPMFGVGSELAATGVNGPAIFPSTALAARLRVEAGKTYGAFAVVKTRAPARSVTKMASTSPAAMARC